MSKRMSNRVMETLKQKELEEYETSYMKMLKMYTNKNPGTIYCVDTIQMANLNES